jgi:oligoendopeptidase F
MTYKLGKWSLTDLFPSHTSDEVKTAFETVETLVVEFESYREILDHQMDVEEFMIVVEQQEAISLLTSRIRQYSELWFAEDTQNQDALTFQTRVHQFLADINNRTLFFDLWWRSLEEPQTQRFYAVAQDYRYWLEQIRDFKPYTLTEAEEKVINLKDITGINAMRILYNSITNRYLFTVQVNGQPKAMTRGELMTLVQGSDPELRAAAYQELYKVFGNDGPILGQMYQTIVRDFANEHLNLRGFSAPISVRNLYNDIPDQVVNTLLDVAETNAHIFQRYFRLKAKWLKVDKLRRYDIYAPVASADKNFEYLEAIKLVLEAFEDFDPQIAQLARRVFEQKHIDSSVRNGKRSGAFCSSADPKITPFVLVNFNGKANDVGTLAHELGHAIHSMLAEHHNVFTFHSTLPMAETASTFAEMLLMDLLLEKEQDEIVRRNILFSQVDDAYATIMRQIFFALFERQAHAMIARDASVEDLADAYMKNLEKQFGESITLSDEFRWEWVSIPHIYHTPFYVYAYAFGQLLVLALYQQYQQEGKTFIPRLLEILSAGGSMPPVDILDKAGIDVRTAEFWQGGFDLLSKMVDGLEVLPVE